MSDRSRSAAKADVPVSKAESTLGTAPLHRSSRNQQPPQARFSPQFNAIDNVARLAVVARMDTRRFVYVLESIIDSDRHYTGLTADVVKRLRSHNDSRAIHTSKFAPWRLLVAIEFADTNCAARFEKFLKTGSGRAFARHHFR